MCPTPFRRPPGLCSKSACARSPLAGTRTPCHPDRSSSRSRPGRAQLRANTWPFPSKPASRRTHRQCGRPARSFCPASGSVFPTPASGTTRPPSAFATDLILANRLLHQPAPGWRHRWETPGSRCCWSIVRRSADAADPPASAEDRRALWDSSVRLVLYVPETDRTTDAGFLLSSRRHWCRTSGRMNGNRHRIVRVMIDSCWLRIVVAAVVGLVMAYLLREL